MSRRGRLALVGGIAAAVVCCDQVTKAIALDELANHPVHVLGPLSFALSFNTGVAFSLGAGLGAPIIVVVLVLVAIVVALAWRTVTRLALGALGLILGGALSNLCDRIFRGHDGAVVDFIHTGFWPTFNLADAAVTCGCIGLALVVVFDRHHPGPPDRHGGTPA